MSSDLEEDIPEVDVEDLSSIFNSLKNKNKERVLNKNETKELLNVKFADGKPVLSLESRYFLLEVAHMLLQFGYQQTLEFLKKGQDFKGGTDNQKRKAMLFLGPTMEKQREKFQIDMEIYRNKQDVRVGGETCKRCGSENTMSVEKQLKKADEPATIFTTCLDCGKKWVI